jgi:hypothetical protein
MEVIVSPYEISLLFIKSPSRDWSSILIGSSKKLLQTTPAAQNKMGMNLFNNSGDIVFFRADTLSAKSHEILHCPQKKRSILILSDFHCFGVKHLLHASFLKLLRIDPRSFKMQPNSVRKRIENQCTVDPPSRTR